MIKPHKALIAIVALVGVFAIFVSGVFAEGRGVVVAELLNIRSGPDKEAQVTGRLAQGVEVRVIDTKDEWYQIAYDQSSTGWVVAEYLKVDFDVVQATADDVNIRNSPSTDAPVTTQVQKFDRFIMLDRFNDWFKIKLENGESGWVNDQYAIITGVISRGLIDGEDARGQSTIRNVKEPTKPAVKMAIKGKNVNFRSDPDLDAPIVATLEADSVVTVLDSLGEWRRVKTADGQAGYINKMFLKEIKPVQVTAAAPAGSGGKTVIVKGGSAKSGSGASSNEENVPAGNGTSKAGSNLVAYAKQFMGIRYKWGGTTTKGFDCSGYTQYVMRHFGVSIPRVSRDQARGGTAVKKADLRVGDIIYFAKSATNRTVNHVGIYIGSGNFIHSSSGGGGKGVTISNLNSGSYAKRFAGARRYLKS
ncbi:MAG: SH3 domain-containing protein [Clostridiales bacterium]|nr:SH3 domain-containing protein [Clostridiales bacterium]